MKKLFIVFVLILSTLDANIDKAIKAYYAKDFKKALPIFKDLNKEGNIESNYYLGSMYYSAYGVKQDYKKAFEYYMIASSQANKKRLNSILNIATMYMQGKGVEKSNKKAFHFFKILDKENVGVAQYMLGIMYSNGYGVQEDQRKAFLYYKKGCNSQKNYPKACYYAGDHYEKGIGVEENYLLAKRYYEKACKVGIEESCEAIKSLESQDTFLEKWLKRSWFNLILMVFSLFVIWKYRKKK